MSKENNKPLSIVVLISGSGSNLQAIIDAIHDRDLGVNIRAVISNRADAYGLKRAKQANIPTEIISAQTYPDRANYDQQLKTVIERYQPEVIVLAGFMRILSAEFVNYFYPRIINIHPSLLPDYPGLNTHEKVLADGKELHGCSIHLVTSQLDAGPLIAQGYVKISPTDDIALLTESIHKIEHLLYPTVLRWFSEQRIAVHEQNVFLDKQLLPKQGKQFSYEELQKLSRTL